MPTSDCNRLICILSLVDCPKIARDILHFRNDTTKPEKYREGRNG